MKVYGTAVGITNMDKTTRKFVPKSARLMDQVREVLRFHHYTYNTEKSYISWILKYIRFHDKKHPKVKGKREIEVYLSHLAINRNVSASKPKRKLDELDGPEHLNSHLE